MLYVLRGNKVEKAKGKAARQLTGDKIPGDLEDWLYYGTDPNALLAYSYDKLSQRSSTLFHTHPPVSAAINRTATYAVGPGLKFRSKPDWKILGITEKHARDWAVNFQSLVHYTFLNLNFYSKQSTVFRTADIEGDAMLLFVRDEDGDFFDLIDVGGDYIDFKAKPEGDEKITLGILHDKFLRRQGFCDTDSERILFEDEDGRNAVQYYNKYIARQLRGYPLAYKIIAAAKNNDRWWDATLQRLVLESIMLGYVSDSQADFGSQIDELAKRARANSGEDGEKKGLLDRVASKLLGGSIYQFKGSGEMKFTDLKTPSNNFDKVQEAYIDLVGMATDVPPEVIASKYSTSFTAHKGALNDFVKTFIYKRSNFERMVGFPVLFEVAQYLFATGQIEPPHPDFDRNKIIQLATLAGLWLGPVPGHINPKVEVDALIAAKNNAFITPADAASSYSFNADWDNQLEEWETQMQQWIKINQQMQGSIMQKQEEKLDAFEDEKRKENDE